MQWFNVWVNGNKEEYLIHPSTTVLNKGNIHLTLYVFWGKQISVSKFVGKKNSVSDMSMKKYSESTSCLKKNSFVVAKKTLRCSAERKNPYPHLKVKWMFPKNLKNK